MYKQIIAGLLASFTGTTSVFADGPTIKAVMQINSPSIDIVVRGLKNAKEISEDAQAEGAKVDLRLVIFGRAVDFFESGATGELRTEVTALSKRGDVHFFVDERTLKRIHREAKDLLPGFSVVPSGAFHVLKLERDGFFYIKP